jgi:hypothetical protein
MTGRLRRQTILARPNAQLAVYPAILTAMKASRA